MVPGMQLNDAASIYYLYRYRERERERERERDYVIMFDGIKT